MFQLCSTYQFNPTEHLVLVCLAPGTPGHHLFILILHGNNVKTGLYFCPWIYSEPTPILRSLQTADIVSFPVFDSKVEILCLALWKPEFRALTLVLWVIKVLDLWLQKSILSARLLRSWQVIMVAFKKGKILDTSFLDHDIHSLAKLLLSPRFFLDTCSLIFSYYSHSYWWYLQNSLFH